jgi:hypothetical protein
VDAQRHEHRADPGPAADVGVERRS